MSSLVNEMEKPTLWTEGEGRWRPAETTDDKGPGSIYCCAGTGPTAPSSISATTSGNMGQTPISPGQSRAEQFAPGHQRAERGVSMENVVCPLFPAMRNSSTTTRTGTIILMAPQKGKYGTDHVFPLFSRWSPGYQKRGLSPFSPIFPHTYSATSNRLSSVAGPTPLTYAYDNLGSPTSDGVRNYIYDATGRLIRVVLGSTSMDFAINAMGSGWQRAAPPFTTT